MHGKRANENAVRALVPALIFSALSSCSYLPSLGLGDPAGPKANTKGLGSEPRQRLTRAMEPNSSQAPNGVYPPPKQVNETIDRADLLRLQDGEETEEKPGVKEAKGRQAPQGLEGKEPLGIPSARAVAPGKDALRRLPEWSLPDFNSLAAMPGHKAGVIGIFQPLVNGNGSTAPAAVSVDSSGQVLAWDIERAKAYELLSLDKPVEQAAFYADALLLAVSYANIVEVYSLVERALLAGLNRLQTRITALDFQPRGQSVLLGGADGRVYRWKFAGPPNESLREQDKILERYIGHAAVISSVAFHPHGRFFFSADWRGAISAWLTYDSDIFGGAYDENPFAGRAFAEQRTRTMLERGAGQAAPAQLKVSKDGQFLLAASQHGDIEWWSVRGLRKLAQVEAHKGLIYDFQVSPDNRCLATAGRDGKVRIWTLEAGQAKMPAKISKQLEVVLPDVRVLGFIGSELLLAGEQKGRVLAVKTKVGE